MKAFIRILCQTINTPLQKSFIDQSFKNWFGVMEHSIRNLLRIILLCTLSFLSIVFLSSVSDISSTVFLSSSNDLSSGSNNFPFVLTPRRRPLTIVQCTCVMWTSTVHHIADYATVEISFCFLWNKSKIDILCTCTMYVLRLCFLTILQYIQGRLSFLGNIASWCLALTIDLAYLHASPGGIRNSSQSSSLCLDPQSPIFDHRAYGTVWTKYISRGGVGSPVGVAQIKSGHTLARRAMSAGCVQHH